MISKSLKIFAANAAGIKSKIKSFNNIISSIKPQIWMLQETKLSAGEHIRCEALNDFQIFYLNRQDSQGGGVALGIKKDIEATLIRDGNDETEIISVQVELGIFPIRIIVAYAPQENANSERKKNFWDFVENEIQEAELQNHGVILQMDGNLHPGPDVVKNDPNPQNRNGKIFMDFLSRNKQLEVLNCQEHCEGVITRIRKLEMKTEKAVLDFCIINRKLMPFFKKMIIDEEREFCLTNTAQIKKNKRLIESDHNSSLIDFNIEITNRALKREELFNFKNKRCQAAFKDATENNPELLECFNNNLTFKQQSKAWKRQLNSVFFKCFKKIRINSNKQKEQEKFKIFEKLKEMKKMKKELTCNGISEEIKHKIEIRVKELEEDIEKEISEEHLKEMMETLKQIGGQKIQLVGRAGNICGNC